MTTKKHNSQIIPRLLLALCLLIVVAVIAINVLRSSYKHLSLTTTTPTPVSEYYPVPTFLQTKPAPLSLEKGHWLKYTNTEFGFSFKYPAEWKLNVYEDKTLFPPAIKNLDFLFDGPVWRPSEDVRYNGFSMNIYPNPQHLSPEDWIIARLEDKNKLLKFGSSDIHVGNAVRQSEITDASEWLKANNEVRGPDIGEIVQSNKDSSFLFEFFWGGPTFTLDVWESDSPYKAIPSSFFFSK